MAQQNINIGTSANKGDGDPIRTAFTKVNANFTELFANHDGTISHSMDIKGSVFGDDSTVLIDAVSNKINLDGTVKGNIIPDTNVTYDIGSSSYRFKDLWLSGTTIHIGSSTMSVDNTGNFQFSGGIKSNNPIVGDDSTLLVDTANSSIPYAVLSGTPTTVSGYGITDALALGTSATTALAGDTTFSFASITSTPTTLAGYGITDGGSGTYSGTSDGITEGSVNLYFTDVRADARITNAGSANWNTAYGWGDHSGAGYLTSTGVLSSHTDVHTTAATDGQVLKWDNGNTRWAPADDTDTDTIYTSFDSDFDTRIGTKSTTDLSEGTNLYYTDVRADARIALAGLTTLTDVDAVVAGDDGKILYYDHGTTSFKWKADATGGGGPADTDALEEGSTNLYYTDVRADARADLKITALQTAGFNGDVSGSVFGDDSTVLVDGVNNSIPFNVLSGTPTTIAGYGITDAFDGAYGSLSGAPTMYANSDVDSHINQSNPTSGYVLSWSGSDYAWVEQSGGGGSQNVFSTIAIDGEDDVVADATTDTLSFEAGSNMTITTNATTDTVTFAAASGGGGGGDLRNYLIDGDFTQWMEHTSIVLGEEGDQKFTSTLMRYEKTGDVEYTASRSTDVPTAAQSGHQSKYSLKMLNSGDNGGTVGVSDYSRLTYTITGSDYASLHGGQDLMLSFWVKSSMTGTYVVGFRNGQAPPERAMPMEYTISAANTWEKKNIAFTTDATGTWYFDEINAGLKIHWGLLSGDDFDGTSETWGGDGYLWATSNQVNHGATQGGTFYLSQVALYKTDTAPTNYLGDPIPLVKDKVGYYYRKSYRDFDNPGTATQIGSVVFKTNTPSSQTPILSTSVTFGSRMRNLGDGSQPDIKLYDNAGNSDQISYWDGGVATDNKQGDYEYHCESGFHVKTDNTTGKDGFSFHYVVDVRHIGDEGGML